MKKNLYAILTLIMVLAVSLFAFAGCETVSDSSSSNNANKPCSILVSDNDKVVIAVNEAEKDQTLSDVMTILKNENFDFKYEDGAYGAFITEVNGRKPVGADYWAVYTSDAENGNATYGTYEYNGQTLVSASFGISGLKVKASSTYALVYNHVADSEIKVSDNDKVVIAVNVAKENQTLFDVMTSLKNDNFDFKYEDGAYGAFITEVNGRKPVGADYWAVYTSDTENGSADSGTYKYNGQTLIFASWGISGLKVKPYATYALVYNHVADSEIKVSDNDKVVIAVNVAKENQTLFDVMTSLKNDNFDFKYEDGAYGAFITEVNGRKPTGNDYWAVYTSDAENGNADYGTYEYNGQTLVSASFGISGLKVKPYATYAIVYTKGKTI